MTISCRHYHRVWLILLLCLCSTGVGAQGIAKGADVSWLNQQAANNPPQVFRDAAGNTTDFIKLFKDVGGNAIRLRVCGSTRPAAGTMAATPWTRPSAPPRKACAS